MFSPIFSYSKKWQLFGEKYTFYTKKKVFGSFLEFNCFFFKIEKVYHQRFFLYNWTKLPSILYPSWEKPSINLYQWEYYSTNCYLLRAMQVFFNILCVKKFAWLQFPPMIILPRPLGLTQVSDSGSP